MQNNDPQTDNIYWNLLLVSLRAKKNLMPLAEAHGLNLMQLYTLCSVDKENPIPMNALSSILVCDASTVTGITDFLYGKGLITRTESAHDRRVKVLALTEKGDTLKNLLLTEIKNFESAALAGLSDTQRTELLTITSIILTASDKG